MEIYIVMTYFERWTQLKRTLDTIKESSLFSHTYIMIVDDRSTNETLRVYEKEIGESFRAKIFYTESEKKTSSSVDGFNFLFRLIPRDALVIIQNAECMHVGDVLKSIMSRVDMKPHTVIFPECWSTYDDSDSQHIFDCRLNTISLQYQTKNARGCFIGVDGWYNHKTLRPIHYHFCVGMKMETLLRSGVFHLGYSCLLGFDDDHFRDQLIYRTPDINVQYLDHSHEPFVVHQHHKKHYCSQLLDFETSRLYHTLFNRADIVLRDVMSFFHQTSKIAWWFNTEDAYNDFVKWHPSWITFYDTNVEGKGFRFSYAIRFCRPLEFIPTQEDLQDDTDWLSSNVIFVDKVGRPLFEWLGSGVDHPTFREYCLDSPYILCI